MAEPRNTSDAKRSPERTCVGCGSRDDAAAMLRLVVVGGAIVFDLVGGAPGRGAHVHPRANCMARAARGGVARAMKVKVDASEFAAGLVEACQQRLAKVWKKQAALASEINKLVAAIDAAKESDTGARCSSRRPEAR